MAQQYGQTWWGGEWLKALSQIDYDNRLPRGRTYANKGAVKNLQIQDSRIDAKVQGSRPSPYKLSIEVPQWTPAQQNKLLDGIANDPTLIARLLNRELDPALLDLAKSLDIPVFPKQWRDLSMLCSCPDWAVPCKHLAAAINVVSREIDGNPFLVFALRGLDLTTELKTRGIHIDAQQVALPNWFEALQAVTIPRSDLVESIAELDFAKIPAMLSALTSVLPAQTSFYGGKDFVAVYEKTLKKIGKAAAKAILKATPESTTFLAMDTPHIALSAKGALSVSGISSGTSISNLRELVDALGNTPPALLPDLQPQVAALYQCRWMALHLLAQGAVVPQLHQRDKKETGLRWLPAMLDPQVAAQMIALAQVLPADLLSLDKKSLPPLAQAMALCSLMLGDAITRWVEPVDYFKINGLFFIDLYAKFDGTGESEVAGSIAQWLSRFHLAQREYAPILCLDEGDDADFALSLSVGAASSAVPPVTLAQVLTDAAWQKTRFGVLQSVALLGDFFPPINGYLRQGATQPIAISAEALPALLHETLPLIRLLGIRAMLPKALERLLRPKLSMRVTSSPKDNIGFLQLADLFAFNWTVAIGDHHLSADEFEQMVNNASGVIRFRGEYVFLDPLEIAKLQAQLAKPPNVAGAELVRVALAGEYAGAGIALDAAAQALLKQLSESGETLLPQRLNATLRPYQQRGFDWLYRNTQAGLGSVIADDMGLGKTLQVITTLLKLKQDGGLQQDKALVVVPTSLLTNWEKELARFAPELSVAVYHGSKRTLAAERPDVLLTTFGVVRSVAASLKALGWRVLVIDEAQNIKNPGTEQTKAVKSIPASTFVAMSGTPVENRLSEYWSIMDFANRGFLGTLPHFIKEYATPIQAHQDRQVAARFKKITAPFLLRRLKSDKTIISDLPDKIEQNQYCELAKPQTALYESVVREGLAAINGESDTFKRQGVVLQMILALKQICNHPVNYLKQGDAAFELSGKAQRFLELLDEIHANHEKVIVFTQFREMGELLAGWVAAHSGRTPAFLHGGVSRAQRDTMVENFQTDRTERVLILSLKAGGTGLNLTAASNVIHYDLWWNPAVEAQATDRAYRIGQLKNVQVHRLITRATFEEKIDAMIQAKKELADMAVGSGEQWIGNLSGEELQQVFTLSS